MHIGYKTDVGKLRLQNEDSFFVNEGKPVFAVVADGMGGHNAGEIASGIAVDTITKKILEYKRKRKVDYDDVIRDAFVAANKQIYEYAKENQKMLGMGTTTVMAIIFKGKLFVGNVGDSRAYIIKDNEIRQISVDHSYVWQLVQKGEITEQQAKRHPKRNYITRAMGTDEFVCVDTFCEEYSGGIILLCSDGLTNLVENYEIKQVLSEEKNLQKAADRLVDMANDRGGTDNITVALFEE